MRCSDEIRDNKENECCAVMQNHKYAYDDKFIYCNGLKYAEIIKVSELPDKEYFSFEVKIISENKYIDGQEAVMDIYKRTK